VMPPPKVVVLMVGVNNLWSGKNSSEEIVAGLRAVVEKLRSKVPDSQILVLGLLPVGADLTDVNRQRATEFNVLAAQLEEWNNVSFLNPGMKFLRRDGKLIEGLFQSDNIHLTAKGYDLFAKELTPAVMDLLKPAAPAAEPVKAQPELGPVGR
jgi:lysophospholipase L1-like esterase